MEQFINAVRKQPCLWNPQHPDYRDFLIKDEAWQNVVDIVGIQSIQAAKLEWKKLRDNHRDALKRAKLGKNKLLPAQITTWKYAKAMQFLEPHMKYRITENIESNETSTSSTTHVPDHDVTTTEADPNTNITPMFVNYSIEQPPLKRIRKDYGNDALESFFHCILQSTRVMPQWLQTQVKKKVFAVIIDAEEELNMHKSQETEGEDQPTNDNSIKIEVKTEIITEDE